MRARPFPPERAALYPAVIGCDEVGRGALCGPVVVAAVWFDPCAFPPALLGALDDSKRLTRRQRETLAAGIMTAARVAFAGGSAARIDAAGIRGVTLDAMRVAVTRLGVDAPVLVDGRDTPPGLDAVAIVRGDASVPQIAAASIVAKVARDRLMRRLAIRYPGYDWACNVGYGAPRHLAAIADIGPSRHHRFSFAPISPPRR